MNDQLEMERPMEKPLLRVQSLVKSFPAVGRDALTVLQDVSFEVYKGEVIAIVGESGTGKSTLLHILGALDKPDSGDIYFAETLLQGQTDLQLSQFRNARVGFVFQFHHLLPEFTALENVMMPALVGGSSPAEARPRAQELLNRVGLTEREAHRPSELSGGEKQRVAIARALMNAPDLILADEPTGNLDEHTADQLHREMIRLSREMHQTFVLVTHNKSFAAMADRTFRLEHGALVQLDPKKQQPEPSIQANT